jgi:hypothetical protein
MASLARGERMIARQDGDERFLGDGPILDVGPWLRPEKREVQLAACEIFGELRRMLAQRPDFDIA